MILRENYSKEVAENRDLNRMGMFPGVRIKGKVWVWDSWGGLGRLEQWGWSKILGQWLGHLQVMDSGIKRSEALTLTTTWMDPGDTILSERSRHRRRHRLWFHWWEMSRTGRSTDTGGGFVGARTWWRGVTAKGDEVAFWGYESVWKLYSGDDCTILWKSLNCTH